MVFFGDVFEEAGEMVEEDRKSGRLLDLDNVDLTVQNYLEDHNNY